METLAQLPGERFAGLRRELTAGAEALDKATDWLCEIWAGNPRLAAAGATPYLRLLGTLGGGWVLARQAVAAARQLEAANGHASYLEGKISTARFYADNILPQAAAAAAAVTRGAETTLELEDAQF